MKGEADPREAEDYNRPLTLKEAGRETSLILQSAEASRQHHLADYAAERVHRVLGDLLRPCEFSQLRMWPSRTAAPMFFPGDAEEGSPVAEEPSPERKERKARAARTLVFSRQSDPDLPRTPVQHALIEMRRRLGLSQLDLSRRMRAAPNSIAVWETSKPPRLTALALLSAFALRNGNAEAAAVFDRALDEIVSAHLDGGERCL